MPYVSLGGAGNSAVAEIVAKFFKKKNSEFNPYLKFSYQEAMEKGKIKYKELKATLLFFLIFTPLVIAYCIYIAVDFALNGGLAEQHKQVVNPETGALETPNLYTVGPETNPIIIILIVALSIVVPIVYFRRARKSEKEKQRSLYEAAITSPHVPIALSYLEAKELVENEISRLVSGKKYRDSWLIQESEYSTWAIGAKGEILTGQTLENLPNSFGVVNDITLLKEDGTTAANIDHLVFGANAIMMLDSKVWKDMPDIEVDNNSRKATLYSQKHVKALNTCLYEMELAEVSMQALIFVLSGNSSTHLNQDYGGVVEIGSYIDRSTGGRVLMENTRVWYVTREKLLDLLIYVDNENAYSGNVIPDPNLFLLERSRVKLSTDIDPVSGIFLPDGSIAGDGGSVSGSNFAVEDWQKAAVAILAAGAAIAFLRG